MVPSECLLECCIASSLFTHLALPQVGRVGFEPTRVASADFKSAASALPPPTRMNTDILPILLSSPNVKKTGNGVIVTEPSSLQRNLRAMVLDELWIDFPDFVEWCAIALRKALFQRGGQSKRSGGGAKSLGASLKDGGLFTV